MASDNQLLEAILAVLERAFFPEEERDPPGQNRRAPKPPFNPPGPPGGGPTP